MAMAKKGDAARAERPVGLTRGAGWEIGARRTFGVAPARAWSSLLAPEGVVLWLGDTGGVELRPGAEYRLPDGTAGVVRVFRPGGHLRLTWHPPGWPRPSTLQLRVMESRGRSVVAFHQEHLPGAAEREERRRFFASVLDRLEKLLAER